MSWGGFDLLTPGGLVLLAIIGFVALLVVVGILAGVAALGRAFMDGWRKGNHRA